MNKTDLVDRLAPHVGGRQAAGVAIEALVDVIIREVAAGETVGITGFGTFERVERAPRTGRNPRTGQRVPIGRLDPGGKPQVVQVPSGASGLLVTEERASGPPGVIWRRTKAIRLIPTRSGIAWSERRRT